MIDRNWLASQLAADGTVRHIIADGATVADWQRLWTAVRRLQPPATFRRDGCGQPMPRQVAPVFAAAPAGSAIVEILWQDMPVQLRLYGGTEADFTIDPGAIDGSAQASSIVDLLGWIGDLLGRSISLIHENQPDYGILRYDPQTARYDRPVWPAGQASVVGLPATRSSSRP